MKSNPVSISVFLVAICAIPVWADDVPRTATGQPDFSGTYDVASLTPWQRPRELGNTQQLSVEQARAREQAALDRVAAGDAPSDPERGTPEKGGNIGFYNFGWLDLGDSLVKIDGKYRTSIIIEPPNGRLPPLSEAGEVRRGALQPATSSYKNDGTAWWLAEGADPYDDPEGLTLGDRCIYHRGATVPVQPRAYNNMKTIVQTGAHVLIHIEWMHWARIVRLDSAHLPSEIRSLSGDSIGWWEGDTLVVDTTNFLDQPGVPREGLRIVERFSPLEADSLLYRFTVYDPDYTMPYSGEYPWPKSDLKSYEYACHEGNYSMANTLRGARQLEREWIEERNGPQG